MLGPPVAGQLNEVEEQDGEANYQGLPHLNAVDASQDVNGICTEHGQHSHVYKVENTCKNWANDEEMIGDYKNITLHNIM